MDALLADELWLHIFDFLSDTGDIRRLRRVCRRFRDLLRDPAQLRRRVFPAVFKAETDLAVADGLASYILLGHCAMLPWNGDIRLARHYARLLGLREVEALCAALEEADSLRPLGMPRSMSPALTTDGRRTLLSWFQSNLS